ncbi:MAG: ATP-binding protein [Bacteroidetes bacterium]|nr:ATP-binding protein [Bacteroidota bacterium]
MKNATLLIICWVIFSAINISEPPKLVEKWRTSGSLKTPESVFFDRKNHVLYVSNINGSPTEKDGNGFISKVSLEGEVIKPMWVTGLNAPKGMGATNGMLYVTDIDQVVKINIETGTIVKRYPIKGANFLNDITIAMDDMIIISDMGTGKIHQLSHDNVSLLFEGLNGPNGVLAEGKDLRIGGRSGIIQSLSLMTNEMIPFITGTGSIDGLVSGGKSDYFISDWKGNIHHVTRQKVTHLIDLSQWNMNAADIEFIPEESLLLVPTFHDNRVVAYHVSR